MSKLPRVIRARSGDGEDQCVARERNNVDTRASKLYRMILKP